MGGYRFLGPSLEGEPQLLGGVGSAPTDMSALPRGSRVSYLRTVSGRGVARLPVTPAARLCGPPSYLSGHRSNPALSKKSPSNEKARRMRFLFISANETQSAQL